MGIKVKSFREREREREREGGLKSFKLGFR